MNLPLIKTDDYRVFIQDIKHCIQHAQIKAAVSVNQELIHLYWTLAEQIVIKQQQARWGEGFLQQISQDLKTEFPDMKGFSKRNLEFMRQWYRFWSQGTAIAKQAVSQLGMPESLRSLLSQIPWGHHVLLIGKIKDRAEAEFYLKKTIKNNWSRTVLIHQIESGLYQREGQAVSNFQVTLPAPQSDLANQTLKDPYNFDVRRDSYDGIAA